MITIDQKVEMYRMRLEGETDRAICRRRNRRCKGYTVSCAKMDVEGDAE